MADLIAAVGRGERNLSDEELARVLAHVARAGFASNALERARGSITGLPLPDDTPIRRRQMPPAEVHYSAMSSSRASGQTARRERAVPAVSVGSLQSRPVGYSSAARETSGNSAWGGHRANCTVRAVIPGSW